MTVKPVMPWKLATPLELPWKQPDDLYGNDGPEATTTVVVRNHEFRVAPTGDSAMNTGRMRYRVECLTCDELVHEGSTSATAQIRFHLRPRANSI